MLPVPKKGLHRSAFKPLPHVKGLLFPFKKPVAGCLILSATLVIVALSGMDAVLNESTARYCLSAAASPSKKVVPVAPNVPPLPLVSLDSRIQPSCAARDFNVIVNVLGVRVAVSVAVLVMVGVIVAVIVPVGEAVAVLVAVAVMVRVGVEVLVVVAVAVAVGVAVSV